MYGYLQKSITQKKADFQDLREIMKCAQQEAKSFKGRNFYACFKHIAVLKMNQKISWVLMRFRRMNFKTMNRN